MKNLINIATFQPQPDQDQDPDMALANYVI